MHTVTKQYRNLPAAHRQPKHDGHCRLIHGHNWGFDITLACDEKDDNDFVIDVGKFQCVKLFLEDHFDHTLLLNKDDELINDISAEIPCKVVEVPNCGMEGLAEFVYNQVSAMIGDDSNKLYDRKESTGQRRGLRVVAVTCWEDEKNCATYAR